MAQPTTTEIRNRAIELAGADSEFVEYLDTSNFVFANLEYALAAEGVKLFDFNSPEQQEKQARIEAKKESVRIRRSSRSQQL